MQNQISNGLVASLLTLTLTACGGGGGGTSTSANENSNLTTFLSQVDNSENIVSSLEVIDGNVIALHSTSPQNVSVQNEGRQFVAVVEGRRYTFPRTDGRAAFGANVPATRFNFLSRRQEYVNDVLTPDIRNDYILFNYGVSNQTTGRYSWGYVVTGIQTPPDAIPTTASATYSGGMYVTSITFDSPARNVPLIGNLEMQVDFFQRTISGVATNIFDANSLYNIPQSAEIRFNQTTFRNDGSYNGTVTLSQSFANAVGVVNTSRTTYQGETYGNTAGSLAGVLDVSGATIDGDQFRATGGFYADR